jgi:copper chaperone CopZ
MTTTVFSAPDIMCGGCAASIEKALGGVEGISSVQVDVDAKAVAVTHDGALVSPEAVITRLEHIGFPTSISPASPPTLTQRVPGR